MGEFSGYLAADELYDGPFCVLSLVDNRRGRRLLYEVLERKPTQADVQRFFRHLQTRLEARGLAVQAVTTDGSPLYPEAVQQVFGPVPHQICRFHVIADITLAVLHALAQVRKARQAQLPKLPRGRPTKRDAKLVAHKRREQERISQLFDHRYLFVQHGLSQAERKTLARLTRGQPQLRDLRAIMDEVYRLFDRRCRSETALVKLATLRERAARFTGLSKTLRPLFSPNLEKALLFLDDKLLPATSNAVERGNRRYRKMQRSVYRVRTEEHLKERLAMDLLREAHALERHPVMDALHADREPGEKAPE